MFIIFDERILNVVSVLYFEIIQNQVYANFSADGRSNLYETYNTEEDAQKRFEAIQEMIIFKKIK